ncbi:putative T7SS-secreted protein [Nocardia sp. NPDC057227]|uniref:putative T7SS-secreted protein n=1 Tax=Nocardia sp. NPDC057227 TaxID=3346056 RepID=UPI003633A2CA
MGWNPLDPLADLADAAGDAIDDVAAVVEPAWESGVETLGELADDGLDLLADGAELVGLDGAAEALDDFGDQISSALGGEIEERQLGETQDPKELVRGEPEAIGESAGTLAEMAAAVELTGQGLRSIDGGDWTGEGRAGFDAAYDPQAQLWFDAADAFTDAANTLVEWGYAVESAQRGAADAIAEWNAAIAEENRQKNWWNSLPAETRAETPLVDTWSSRYRAALDLLERARANRNTAAEQAGTAIEAATETAPTEPPFTSRMGANIEDGIEISQYAGLSFADGLLTGLSGIVQFVRQVNPTDPYNLTHPADYLANLSTLGTGVVVLASDPAAAVDAVLNQARTSPFEFTGMLTSEVLLTVATGGAGAARTPLSLVNRVRHALPGRGAPGRGLPDVDLPNPAGRPGAGPPDGPPARAGLGDRPGGPDPAVDTRAPAPDADNPAPGAGGADSAGPQADRPGAPDSAGPEPSIDAGPADRPPARSDPEPQEQPGDVGAGAADTAPPVERAPDTGGDGPGARPEESVPDPVPDRPGTGDTDGPGTGGPGNDPPDPRPDTYTPPDRPDTDARPDTADPPAPRPDPDAPATRPDPDPSDVRPADADTPTRPSPDTSPTRGDGDGPAPRPGPEPRVDADPPPGRADAETPDAVHPRDQTDADLPRDRSDTDLPDDRADGDLPRDRTDTDLPRDRTDGDLPHDRTGTDTSHSGSDPADRPDADGRGDRSDSETPTTRADHDPEAAGPRTDTDPPETSRTDSPDQGPVAPHSPGTHPHSPGHSQSPTAPSPARPDAPAPRPASDLPDPPRRPDPTALRPDPDRPPPRAGLDPATPRRPEITADTNRPPVDARPATPDSPTTRSPEPAPPRDSGPLEQRADSDTGIGDEARSGDPANDRDPSQTTECGDPVDVATGEFLLPTVDLDLPGVLPLTLNRRHRSNYRRGRWFGPSWSTTLDIRLIIDRDGIVFASEDGILLAYPHPQPDTPVRPLSGGSRSTCTRTETGSYRVHDPEREITWHFAPEPTLRGADDRHGNYAISAITDRHHNRIRFHYDTDGAPTAITHSGGYRIRVHTDPQRGRITALALHGEDPEELVVRRFAYETGELAAVTDATGATSRYTYDADGRMLSWIDSRGTSMSNTYDHRGRVVAQHGTHGILSATFEYRDHPTGSSTRHADSLGATTVYGFDSDLRLRDLRTPTGAHTRIDYNSDRKPLTVTGPDGAVTRYLYTPDGDPARIERPDGTSTDLRYAEPGRPSRITGPDGATTHQEWHGDGTLSAFTDPAGARTEFTYHACGAQATITRADGTGTRIETDAAGLPVTVVDPLDGVTHIHRDRFGRPAEITDPLGRVTRYRWSPEGTLLSRTDPDGHGETWAHDEEGSPVRHVNRAGGVTEFANGSWDLRTARTDPDGAVTRYRYDAERRLTAVVNPLGQVWHYAYDPAGQLAAETDYSGAQSRYTRTESGLIATVTPATGDTRTHTYDTLGRLTSVTASSGAWRRFTYDGAGRVRSAISGHGDDTGHTLEFTHTATGAVETETRDGEHTLRHEYDPLGRRTRRTDHAGTQTRWSYDPAGRPATLGADGHLLRFDHDAAGQLTAWAVGEIAVTRDLDRVGRLTAQTVTAHPPNLLALGEPRHTPAELRTDTYTWRPDDYPLARATAGQGRNIRHELTLDPMGRVTTVGDGTVPAENYTYDALSNITAARTTRRTQRRRYRGTRLVRAGRTRYHYDEAGRLTRKITARPSRKPDVWFYRYDGFDQLTDVWTPTRQWWRYTYDALGRRTTKQHLATDGTVLERTDYHWDGDRLLAQAGADSITRWHYQPGTYTLLAQTTDRGENGRRFHAVVSDLVGTPVELIDPADARTVATAESDLWGRTRWTGTAGTPLRFPGQLHDPETGLHYNHHRYYDPETGRYLSSDPLGLDPAPNPDTYPHNPLVWIDPTGLARRECNTNGRNLSDPNPIPRPIREAYENVRAGNGVPRIDPNTGRQTVYQGRELSPRQRSQWAGSLEWDVPGTDHRVLQRPDGWLGYVFEHDYGAPFLFPGPWYPEGGTIPKRLGG